MNKTLTVSIASYNVEKFLRETLDSLCSTDIIEDIEVIIEEESTTEKLKQLVNLLKRFFDEIVSVITTQSTLL